MATIGTTAPAQNTINYNDLLTTTLFNYRKTMTDNIFKSNAFLAALRQGGGIDYSNGGERIAQPLMYETNSSVKSYRGYDQILVVPQDGMTTAFYPYSEVAGTITISRREERQNNGEAAILNLLEKKILQAEMSIKAAINSQLVLGSISSATFVPGNDEKDLLPLGWFLRKLRATDPTSTEKVGSILAATYAWWKAQTADFSTATPGTNSFAAAVTTYKGYLNALRKMYNTCANGADGTAPNLLLATQGSFELYCNALQNQVQYTDLKLAEIGFDSVKLRGATMIYDELVPDVYTGTAAITKGTVFFLNTKYYKLTIDRETDFITTPFVEPENQTAKTAKILFMGNATSSNQRKLGVALGIDETIAA
jgi:hypothetical protein